MSGPPLRVVKRKRGVDLPDGARGVVTTVYDVTEIKRSEMELREHRDHLQELVGRGQIRLEGRTIVILDRAGLARRADQ